MIKRADIIKFNKDNKFVLHPINTLEGGGGIASSPYVIDNDLTYIEIAEKLLTVLNCSKVGVPQPLDWSFFRKEHLKAMRIKSMKILHEDSLNVGVFTKDGNYHISPTVNKGPRQGFQGAVKDRIVIPLSSSVEELASALEEAFKKSS
ncbi:CdiI family contact-dependent growth inhibition immunity protein [Sinomicrobium kalidii]|uniref:contact-dependent growth inhibition system immunity protein n=1 Tax=Sinomicrobium kalidii TaxID=2900738 RepID=UPI001E487362|nr:contact-dependent growth inhibition system immunity protein [Sinomicrobium kalidii]UGU18120.1 CdiI family contact-dependent growth inhibition immunity protein [Sinomicrobium kalidii]